MRFTPSWWFVLGSIAAVAACSSKSDGRAVRIAAAADLGAALGEIGKAFTARTGIVVQPTYGSSGLLAKQIGEGAPYYLFAAASRAYAQQAVATGRCDGASAQLYGRGRIVIWTRDGVRPARALAELTHEAYRRIAIASPDHAPYGLAARQALERAKLWDTLHDRIVIAENAQQTMLYATNGNADAAIVALSLAVVSTGGSYASIDDALYEPLDQQLVVCGDGPEAAAARQLADFIGSPDGRAIMAKFGFAPGSR